MSDGPVTIERIDTLGLKAGESILVTITPDFTREGIHDLSARLTEHLPVGVRALIVPNTVKLARLDDGTVVSIDGWLAQNDYVVIQADLMRELVQRLGDEIVDESDRKAWVIRTPEAQR